MVRKGGWAGARRAARRAGRTLLVVAAKAGGGRGMQLTVFSGPGGRGDEARRKGPTFQAGPEGA